MSHQISVASIDELSPRVLYALLRLRNEVFVVEQEAAYDDIDGRDAEPGALLVWATDDEGAVISTARVLHDPPDPGGEVGMRIGRVATAASARGVGVAAALMRESIRLCGDAPIVLDAQAYLVDWYGRFGFAVAGELFHEDGIPHYPMLRPGSVV